MQLQGIDYLHTISAENISPPAAFNFYLIKAYHYSGNFSIFNAINKYLLTLVVNIIFNNNLKIIIYTSVYEYSELTAQHILKVENFRQVFDETKARISSCLHDKLPACIITALKQFMIAAAVINSKGCGKAQFFIQACKIACRPCHLPGNSKPGA